LIQVKGRALWRTVDPPPVLLATQHASQAVRHDDDAVELASSGVFI